MENCDVLVIGGGPAGSTAAWRLRRAGYDVLVLDKQDFPRDKVCAGWITPAVVRSLELDTEAYRRDNVFQPITGFRTSRLGDTEAETDYGEDISFGIRRREFDDYLLRRSGARLRLNEAVKSIVRRDGRWIVNDALSAPLLIGAGGHFCPVARHLGARPGSRESIVAAQEVEFHMSPSQRQRCRVDALRPELYFCRDLTGYAWVFRKGDYLNVGLGRDVNHRLAEHVAGFVEFLKQRGRIPADLPDKFKGHAYILYGHTRRDCVDEGVLLIGDAVGLAYPQSGEGIRPAVESALMAVDVIRAAAGDYSRPQLEPYLRRLEQRFGVASDGDKAAVWLPDGLKQYLAGKLLGNKWFARYVVMDRWFLHTHQAVLTPN